MEPINVDIKYTPVDLQKSYELHYNVYYPVRSKLLLILGILLAVVGLLLICLSNMLDQNDGWLGKLYMVLGVLAILYHFWKISTMGKKMFDKMPDFQLPYQVTINSSGICIKSTTVSSEVAWEHYTEAVVTANMILVYTNPFKFNIFRKTAFTDEQFERLSAVVIERVKSVKRK